MSEDAGRRARVRRGRSLPPYKVIESGRRRRVDGRRKRREGYVCSLRICTPWQPGSGEEEGRK